MATRREFFKRLFGGLAVAVGLAKLPPTPLLPTVTSYPNPPWQFGFTGFKPAGEGKLEGRILFSGNLTTRSPRFTRMLRGILD